MYILLLLFSLPFVLSDKYLTYLSHYGYLPDDSLIDDTSLAVKLFQKTYNLKETGELDEETRTFMDTARCGNQDDIDEFVVNPKIKWFNNTITWHMYGGNRYNHLIERAFDLWAKHANLTFIKDSIEANIILSFSPKSHALFSRKNVCPYDFDGPGSVLAHAFLPDTYYNKSDIHFDREENWDYSMNLPMHSDVSFFLVAVHEIGHALGLRHSYVRESAMWPTSQTPKGISNLFEYDLSTDDILAIQLLYGQPQNKKSATSTTTSTTTSTESTTVALPEIPRPSVPFTTTDKTEPEEALPVVKLDICTLRNKIDAIIVVKDKIFAFYNRYVWTIHVDPAKRTLEEYRYPKIITDWLPFLPRQFKRVTAVYQRPNREIVIVSDKEMYFILYPELTLYKKTSVESFVGRKVKNVNAVINNNHGETYMFTDDWYISEIDECRSSAKLIGEIPRILNGIPVNVKGGFRYTDGRLYFLTDSSVLEYNEFTNTVTNSHNDVFDVLQITCMRETLIQKLYDIVKYLQ